MVIDLVMVIGPVSIAATVESMGDNRTVNFVTIIGSKSIKGMATTDHPTVRGTALVDLR